MMPTTSGKKPISQHEEKTSKIFNNILYSGSNSIAVLTTTLSLNLTNMQIRLLEKTLSSCSTETVIVNGGAGRCGKSSNGFTLQTKACVPQKAPEILAVNGRTLGTRATRGAWIPTNKTKQPSLTLLRIYMHTERAVRLNFPVCTGNRALIYIYRQVYTSVWPARGCIQDLGFLFLPVQQLGGAPWHTKLVALAPLRELGLVCSVCVLPVISQVSSTKNLTAKLTRRFRSTCWLAYSYTSFDTFFRLIKLQNMLNAINMQFVTKKAILTVAPATLAQLGT